MYQEWSPAELACAIGYRIDLVSSGRGQRVAWLVKPKGARFRLGANAYDRAHRLLSRVARMRAISPNNRPFSTPRALRDGREVEA